MTVRLVANIAIYQLIWFLCVLGGNSGALAALPLVLLHLILSKKRRADLRMIALLFMTGLLIDGTLLAVGFFSFRVTGWPIPLWLMVIWLALATLPHHSLAWLQGRYLLAALFGVLGGPLAYWAGVRLGAAFFNWPLWTSLSLLAVLWGVLWPAVTFFAGRNETSRNLPGS